MNKIQIVAAVELPREVWESKLDRHQKRLDRLIDLYADGKYDRVTLDRKNDVIQRQLKKARKELETLESEMEQVEKGKAQQARARKKLEELKENGLGTFLEQSAKELDFDDKRRLLGAFFQSRNDYIAISGNRRSLKASGSRASLDCEWRSMFDFNLVKIAGEQVKSGSTLSEALDVAEARRIYLSEEWTPPFSLP